jgi:hypothetical protein
VDDSAETVRLEVSVDEDLRTLRGTMELPPGTALADPLALLPEPRDDLQRLRTFPGPVSQGSLLWQQEDGHVTFTARLPRRYGALGSTRHGLFAAGGWYPAPIGPDGRLLHPRWEVTVQLPPDTGGAVGDSAGTGVLRWTGEGERVGLAVVERPHLTPLSTGSAEVWLLTKGRPRRSLRRHLGEQLALLPMSLRGVAVQAPLRRRLTAHAPGLAFVSDRAWRLSPGLQFAHHEAVTRGVAAALVPLPDPADRELAAAALSEAHAGRLRQLDTDRVLGLLRWLPQVNALLSSQRLPFYSEILGRAWPADPVADDLAEMLEPYAPGTAVHAQLDDTFGPGTGRRAGEGLLLGEPREQALQRAGVPPGFLEPWRRRVPPQDYVLSPEPGAVVLTRVAPPEAPPETLIVRVDGQEQALQVPPGGSHTLQDPRRVLLDPRQHVRQLSRAGDSWPPRYDWTVAGWVDSVNLSQAQLFAAGFLTLRRQYDTHNLVLGSLSNSRSDLVSVEVGYLRKEGPLLDGWTRPHRLRADVGASLLDPAFAETDGLQVALDGYLSYTFDDRVSYDFPLRGRRLSVNVGGGGIPETSTTWLGAGAAATGVVSPHPRWALAGRGHASWASSPLPHRLLILGGEGSMRSLPALPACPAPGEDGEPLPCFPVATERVHGALELRCAVVRGASLPLAVLWGSELQVAMGLEGVAARLQQGEGDWATGVTASVLGLGDMLGADTSALGVLAAWPLLTGGLPVEPTPVPELYLRFGQSF